MTGRHTGPKPAQEVLAVLNEFDLPEKLFCITTDNSSNNGKLMKCLSKALKRQGVIWDAKSYHISCLNHVLNLGVQEFLKKIKVLGAKSKSEGNDLKEYEQEPDDDSDDEEEEEDEEDEEETEEEDILIDDASEDDDGHLDDDFHGTMKKLHITAKVLSVAYE